MKKQSNLVGLTNLVKKKMIIDEVVLSEVCEVERIKDEMR